jgi:hypothetical protein
MVSMQRSFFSYFLSLSDDNVISADKMMNKAKGPVWHKKQKYGHGTFTITFDIDHCWMRGDSNNRWLFAAMGLTIQMHQLEAYKKGKSTWNIKEQVLG